VTILLRAGRQNFTRIFLVLGVLEIGKEIVDFKTLNHRYSDSLWDAVVTFAYPTLILGILKLKTRLAR
jgi:adenine/guanine phosphoribosyltransferase-like PRPP-binding protein